MNKKHYIFFVNVLLACSCFAAFTADNERLLEEISEASFQFFWKEANPDSGLIRDRTGKEVCSVASLGFGLAALPIGVKRGYVSFEQAKTRALNALRTLEKSNAQYKGIYCHFIDFNDGNTTNLGYERVTSTIDTALMIAGSIVAAEYFGGEVKQAAEQIFAQANWSAYVNPVNGQVYMAYDIDKNQFEKQTWDWYTDETLLIVLLGQSAPNAQYRLAPETMTNWNRPIGKYKDGQPFIYSHPGTLFTYMFAHCFYDFQKTGVDSLDVDWFENTRRAVLANRDWCRDNCSEYKSYGQNLWGITAGSGPDDKYVVLGHPPRGANDNQGQYGTLHPYGAGMSLPFAQSDAISALREMRKLKIEGKTVWQSVDDGGYGFWDGFDIDKHWVSDQVIGIAQGPMLLLIENARTGLVWKLMMKNHYVKQGLARAGFKGKF
ncbi:MAG: hypothetical protein A2Y10_05475 [Planctomycetes bacterium GWF2_41_51]|nr:MAG: hypothetical protein A2Y10_05475 [Planctomycetes bacterium GWF2_41_51]HBG26791.1 hypothetical protein [Phycisphaerales bacterium]